MGILLAMVNFLFLYPTLLAFLLVFASKPQDKIPEPDPDNQRIIDYYHLVDVPLIGDLIIISAQIRELSDGLKKIYSLRNIGCKAVESAILYSKATELEKILLIEYQKIKELSSTKIITPNVAATLLEILPIEYFPPHAIYWDYYDAYGKLENRKKIADLLDRVFTDSQKDFGNKFLCAFFLQYDSLINWILINIKSEPQATCKAKKGPKLVSLETELLLLLEKRGLAYLYLVKSNVFSFVRSSKEFVRMIYSPHLREFISKMKEESEKSPSKSHIYSKLSQMYSLSDEFRFYHLANFEVLFTNENQVDEYITSYSSLLILILYMSASKFIGTIDENNFMKTFFSCYLNMSSTGRSYVFSEFFNKRLADRLVPYQFILSKKEINLAKKISFVQHPQLGIHQIFTFNSDAEKFLNFCEHYLLYFLKFAVSESTPCAFSATSLLDLIENFNYWAHDFPQIAFRKVFTNETKFPSPYHIFYEYSNHVDSSVFLKGLQANYSYSEIVRLIESEKLASSKSNFSTQAKLKLAFMRCLALLLYNNFMIFFRFIRNPLLINSKKIEPSYFDKSLVQVLELGILLNPKIPNVFTVLCSKEKLEPDSQSWKGFSNDVELAFSRSLISKEKSSVLNDNILKYIAVMNGSILLKFLAFQMPFNHIIAKLRPTKYITSELLRVEKSQKILDCTDIINTLESFRTDYIDPNDSQGPCSFKPYLLFIQCIISSIVARIPEQLTARDFLQLFLKQIPNIYDVCPSLDFFISCANELLVDFSGVEAIDIKSSGHLILGLYSQTKVSLLSRINFDQSHNYSALLIPQSLQCCFLSKNTIVQNFTTQMKRLYEDHFSILRIFSYIDDPILSSKWSFLLSSLMYLRLLTLQGLVVPQEYQISEDLYESLFSEDYISEQFARFKSFRMFKFDLWDRISFIINREMMTTAMWNELKKNSIIPKEIICDTLTTNQFDFNSALIQFFTTLDEDLDRNAQISVPEVQISQDIIFELRVNEGENNLGREKFILHGSNSFENHRHSQNLDFMFPNKSRDFVGEPENKERHKNSKKQDGSIKKARKTQPESIEISPSVFVKPKEVKSTSKVNDHSNRNKPKPIIPERITKTSNYEDYVNNVKKAPKFLSPDEICISPYLKCDSGGHCFPSSIRSENNFIPSFMKMIEQKNLPFRLRDDFIRYFSGTKSNEMIKEYSNLFKKYPQYLNSDDLLDLWKPPLLKEFPKISICEGIDPEDIKNAICTKIMNILLKIKLPFLESVSSEKPQVAIPLQTSVACLMSLIKFSTPKRSDPLEIKICFRVVEEPKIENGLVIFPTFTNIVEYPFVEHLNRIIYGKSPQLHINDPKAKKERKKPKVIKEVPIVVVGKPIDVRIATNNTKSKVKIEDERPLVLPISKQPIIIHVSKEAIPINVPQIEEHQKPSIVPKIKMGNVIVIDGSNYRERIEEFKISLSSAEYLCIDLEFTGVTPLHHLIESLPETTLFNLVTYFQTKGYERKVENVLFGVVHHCIVDTGVTVIKKDGQLDIYRIVGASDESIFIPDMGYGPQIDFSRFFPKSLRLLDDCNFNFSQLLYNRVPFEGLRVFLGLILESNAEKGVYSGWIDGLQFLKAYYLYPVLIDHSELEKTPLGKSTIDIKVIILHIQNDLHELCFDGELTLENIFLHIYRSRLDLDSWNHKAHNADYDAWMTAMILEYLIENYPQVVESHKGILFRL
jgi:hypothetical protein